MKTTWFACLCLSLLLAPLSRLAAADAEAGARARRLAETRNFFTNGPVLFLKLELPKSAMQTLRRNHRTWVTATLRDGDTTLTNISIRLKGGAGSFRGLDSKPGFTLKLDDNAPAYHGLRKFHLNNSVQDPSCMSEWACGEMFRLAGVPAPRAAHAYVELNGRPLGLYVLLESVNRDFLANYFKHTKGHIYGQSSNADINDRLDLMSGEEIPGAGKDLDALAKVAEQSGGTNLASVLDVDRFLSFIALEIMLNHWDGYSLNVKNYVVFSPENTGKIVFLPHDLDQLFRDAQASIFPRPRGLVTQAVLKDPALRRQYLNRFASIYTNIFALEDWPSRINAKANQVADAVAGRDSGAANAVRENTSEFLDRMNRRLRALNAQLHLPGHGMPLFNGNVAQLKGWRAVRRQGSAVLKREPDADGKSALHITMTSPASASWRLKLFLEPGRYLLEGYARTEGVEPVAGSTLPPGAGLRVVEYSPSHPDRLLQDSPRTRLIQEFQVEDSLEEVDLMCELRASKGDAWFDESSLRLRKMD